MLKLPEVLGVAEARSELPHVLEDVQARRSCRSSTSTSPASRPNRYP